MAVRAKVLEYEAALDADGRVSAEGCPPLELRPEWEAEHLVLAALIRCSLTSFRYHARRLGIAADGSGRAAGTVTKRETDGRYAFVEIEAALDVSLDRELVSDELRELLLKAERDCFIGASLTVKPAYVWRVGGVHVDTSPR